MHLGGGGEILLYIGYIGMCSPKRVGIFSRFGNKYRYGFSTLVLNWETTFSDLISKITDFRHK